MNNDGREYLLCIAVVFTCIILIIEIWEIFYNISKLI